jgi:uncharacterized membrane protein
MRYLSVSLSVASVLFLWAIARQYLERGTAIVCASLLALSPNFVFLAAEIRAYAAFILFATLLIFGYLRLIAARPDPSRPDLWTFAIAATLCSYTHFFGVIISAGAFICLLVVYLPVDSRTQLLTIIRRATWPLLFYLTSLVGLIPFILAAVRNSRGGTVSAAGAAMLPSARIHDFVRLIYRFFSHQSMLGIPGLTMAALIAGLGLMLLAAMPGSSRRARPILLFLLVNLILIAIAGLSTSAFGAFAPTYNAWALPVIALLAALPLTNDSRYIRSVGAVCIGVLIAANSYAALRLSTAGELYAHTRSTVIKTAVADAGVSNTMVIYVDDAPSLYFALIYDYSGRLRQYIARGGGFQLIGSPVGSSLATISELNSGTLLVAADHELSADALQLLIAHPGSHSEAYRALDNFLQAHHAELAVKWTVVSQSEYLAQSTLALAVLTVHTGDASQSSKKCDAASGTAEKVQIAE